MTGRRWVRWAALSGVASLGVMVGHWLAYDAGIRAGGLRAVVLAQTGHSYLEVAAKIAAVLAVVGLAAIAAARFSDPDPDSSRAERWSAVASRLMVLQLLGFAGMELAERLASGAPLGGLLSHHVLVLGFAIQVLTAVVGALLLVLFDRAAVAAVAAIRKHGSRPRSTDLQGWAPAPGFVRPSLLLVGAAGVRGPPR